MAHYRILDDPRQKMWERAGERNFLRTGRLYRKKTDGKDGDIYIVTSCMISSLSMGEKIHLTSACQALIEFENGSLWTHIETQHQADEYKDVTEEAIHD